MASVASGTSFAKPKRVKGFTTLLSSAACEWILIFLVLVYAVLSYLLMKFARYCKLQIPCLLCSRIDYILGGEKLDFYHSLFCSHHRSEISSLISCHIHGKIANGHRMCDDCLLSFTTNTKHNTKSHRLLVGKLGPGFGGSGSQLPPLRRELFTASKGSRKCTCCGKLWNSEQNVLRSIQLKSSGKAVLKPCIPLPHAPRQSRLNQRDNMKKIRDNFSVLEGKHKFYPISHVGYTELRFTSDSESEFPFSDDDDVANVLHENTEANNEPTAECTLVISPKHTQIDSTQAKPSNSSINPMPSLSDPYEESKISKQVNFMDSDADNDNGPEVINWPPSNQEISSSDPPELISLDDVSPSPIALEISDEKPEDSKIISALNVTQASGTGLIAEKHMEVLEKIGTIEKTSTETDLIISDSSPVSPRQENSSNTSKSPISIKEKEVLDFVIEQTSTKEVDKVKEEQEILPSYNSSSQGSNMSPIVPMNHVLSPKVHSGAYSSNEIHALPKSPSLESILEYLDESSPPEIEGEPIIDRLKRQIKYDKKCLDDLQKELEEERNASAIATNEAMSMITRLQEEKAALQMEALQYLRMMEEQAEYDNGELDKVNDLLTEKEKEIQDLEAELEFYRLNSTDEPLVHSVHEESCDLKHENVIVQEVDIHADEPLVHITHNEKESIKVQNVDVDNITNTVNMFSSSKFTDLSKVSDGVTCGISSLQFEDEKQYILQCLESLEKKLYQISCNGIFPLMSNVRPENLEVNKLNQQGSSDGDHNQFDGHEETDSSIQKSINMSNGNQTDKDGSSATCSDDSNYSTCVGPKISMPKKVDLVTLENEISDLNDRLEALELSYDLLERITGSLPNSNDGKELIQDIARQLHELRNIGLRSR